MGKHRTQIASHRGGALDWPENSPTAFRNTTRLDVEQVEFDVHPTRDHRLAVIHDATLDRTTDGAGPVGVNSFAELQRFTLKRTDGERILPLEDLIEIFRPTPITLRLEIKPDHERRPYADSPRLVVELLTAKRVFDRTVITSFQIETLDAVRSHGEPQGVIWLVSPFVLTDAGLASVIAVARAHRVPALSIQQSVLNADVVKAVRDAGLGIGGWAAHDDAAITKMLDLGVDVFTSDRPTRAVQLRAARA